MVTLEEAKQYLRVDFPDDDLLINLLITTSERLCATVARMDDEAFIEKRASTKHAVLYAVAYLYEHREKADYHHLLISLRSLLEGVRRSEF